MCDKWMDAGSPEKRRAPLNVLEQLERLDICMLRCAAVTAAVADALAYAPADKNTYLPALHLVETQLLYGGQQIQQVLKDALKK